MSWWPNNPFNDKGEGSAGSTGATGSQGPTGSQGQTGSQGATGPAGGSQSNVQNTIHVAIGGSDATGNGQVGNPYATITKAVAMLPTNPSRATYIFVGPGLYSEGTLTLADSCVTFVGSQSQDETFNTAIRAKWAISATANPTYNNRFQRVITFRNVQLLLAPDVSAGMSFTGTTGQVIFQNCYIGAANAFTAPLLQHTGAWYLRFYETRIFSSFNAAAPLIDISGSGWAIFNNTQVEYAAKVSAANNNPTSLVRVGGPSTLQATQLSLNESYNDASGGSSQPITNGLLYIANTQVNATVPGFGSLNTNPTILLSCAFASVNVQGGTPAIFIANATPYTMLSNSFFSVRYLNVAASAVQGAPFSGTKSVVYQANNVASTYTAAKYDSTNLTISALTLLS